MGVDRTWLDEPAVEQPTPGVLVSVGSLLPQKGHDVLVRALARVVEPWTLTIVGDGPQRPALEQLARELGVADRVELVGSQDQAEVRRLLDGAWASALACVVVDDGDRDGIPVALMEAMARGVPVVSTPLGGIPELVGGAGVLVPSGDAAALAEALDRLADPVERQRIGAAGRARVEERFQVATSAARVRALVVPVGPAQST
ncbi:hypothetical protein B7486_64985 [cyanobacterium TDX16]|nr:hypothetical protein B7486_64985 [cyanobacterium TDX16]